jgi:dTDP-4-amino-4,6-dideoxygalactose transaminase
MSSASEVVKFLDLGASHQEVRGALDALWAETIATNGFIGGSQLEPFEEEFAVFCESTNAIGVANGTDALELILRGLSIGPGDEVIVPTNTFIATAEAVVAVGATPIFTDVDPETALITGAHVRAALSRKTVAVIAVHLYGQMVNMDDLLGVAEPASIAVIEDAAQAHGATWKGRRAGSIGIAAGFSFYPGKNLGALGDGGAITTCDAALASRIRSIANHGRSEHSKYEHDLIGRNSRLDGLQAGALRIKLGELERWNKTRRAAAEVYRDALPPAFKPYAEANGAQSAFHLFVVQSLEADRDDVGRVLDASNIQWGIHYPIPCHRQKPFLTGPPPVHEVADAHSNRIVSLPMHPHLSTEQVQRVCTALWDLA